jgi:hypothetical protein
MVKLNDTYASSMAYEYCIDPNTVPPNPNDNTPTPDKPDDDLPIVNNVTNPYDNSN